ncbi:hypothetical protein CVT91_01095 [Candidatus Atribacteria bacterium HGW-Atribacteria-1]|nr:MAG: hypothetical protein CVT91_01095 [Candidatus Atribacteria bacterium HGW-Atribacteria-1]
MIKSSKILKIAIRILEKNLGVKPEETIAIITDTQMVNTAKLFKKACEFINIDPIVKIMSPAKYRGEEPPDEVRQVMEMSDVAILVTTFSLSHTYARLSSTKKGTRIASMGSVTTDMFQYGLSADYDLVAKRTKKLSKYLNNGSTVEINTRAGTNLKFSIANRTSADPDDGLYVNPCQWGNLPAGEAFIAPIENSASGILVANSTISPLGFLKETIILTINKGRIVKISGNKEARKFESFIKSVNDQKAYMVAEFGIGTNDKAKLIGKIIEDEKILGTAHIGFGTNLDFGGVNKSKTHYDILILSPTIIIDRKTIIHSGKFRIKL